MTLGVVIVVLLLSVAIETARLREFRAEIRADRARETARRRAVRDEASEDGRAARRVRGRARRERGLVLPRSRRAIRFAARGASSRDARLGEPLEERLGREIVEWEDREALAAVEPHDGTRREAAEASGCVVQENRTAQLAHRVSSKPSSAARTRSPTVSRT